MSIVELQNYTYYSKYARYNKEKKRRETWEEAVERVKQMHLKKYPQAKEEIDWAFDLVLQQKILGSQRALQFGGKPMEKVNARGYNCIVSYCNRLRFFQETFYLLLCGTGVGFSVQKHHIINLPNFSEQRLKDYKLPKKTFIIPDSIEGWADSLGVLLSSYFDEQVFPEYKNHEVIFDFSEIRPEGSPISSAIGKAPGPKPLKKALEKIKEVLNRCTKSQFSLRPIDAYDIVMHTSDAVLSGGIRRSATIAIFSPNDEEMIKAKTGNWYYENPQRARSNNSVLLLRKETKKEDYLKIFWHNKEFGEPGIVWADSTEYLLNPCFHKDTRIHTSKGLIKISDLYEQKIENEVVVDNRVGKNDNICLENKGISLRKASKVEITQKNADIYELITTDGHSIKATANHEFPTINGRKKLQELKVGDTLLIQSEEGKWGSFGTFEQGLILGLATKGKPNIKCHLSEEMICYETTKIPKEELYNLIEKSLGIKHTKNKVPECMWIGSRGFVCGYLQGLFFLNGIVKSKSLCLKLNKELLQEVQILLNNFGISTKIKKKLVIKDSNLVKLMELVGLFGKKEKQINKLIEIDIKPERHITKVKKIKYFANDDVYCLNQPFSNTVIANGVVTGQCCEIGMFAKDEETDQTGWQACNLSEINGKMIKTEQDFYQASIGASILGTLQAGYTNFEYLGKITEKIIKRESLLGVSITGMMNSPAILFNPEYQRKAAELVKETNKKLAKKIGIPPAARTTCIKPSGTASCLLGTSSGIHPGHYKNYFRRVQANKNESMLQWFKKHNPLAIEKSLWSANGTDEVITFCCETNGKTKSEVGAIELLSYVKLTQENWVKYGKDEKLCTKPWLMHNVSNTINVKPNEWEKVADFIYENRESFTAVSLLPATGDKDFPQAPFCAIYDPIEIAQMYGDGAPMASGLIVDGLSAFDNNLWEACDAVLNEILQKKLVNTEVKKDWVRRAKQFAKRYFNNDLRKMTYCLKDVNHWKLWCDLRREYQNVDYSQLYEKEDNTKPMEEIACGGGACEVMIF